MITFNYLLEQTSLYKKSIIIANILAVVMTLISVPIPLFIPHLIDEVILGKGGDFTSIVNQFIEVSSPKYYILIIFVLLYLSIARVLLDRPKVIIFDESTSSLDNNTENRLLEALDEYIKNKTIITIAHRQTTIDTAERVLNLNA